MVFGLVVGVIVWGGIMMGWIFFINLMRIVG